MWVVSLPVQVGQVPATPPTLTWIDYLGAAVWLVGMVFESVGDWQRPDSRPTRRTRAKLWTGALAVYPPPQLLR